MAAMLTLVGKDEFVISVRGGGSICGKDSFLNGCQLGVGGCHSLSDGAA